MPSICIWAPHPDDEIIGCWSVLSRKHLAGELAVWYFSGFNDPGIERARTRFGFSISKSHFSYVGDCMTVENIVLAPDPASDWHPLHQEIGNTAQGLFRSGRIKRLILYTTRMSVPYVCEVSDPEAKRAALEYCYPEKRSLWEADHRFFLFEGHIELRRLDCPV